MSRRPLVRPHLRRRRPEKPAKPARFKHATTWIGITLATALIGAMVTFGVDYVKKRRSEQVPLDIHVSTAHERERSPFYSLIVTGELPATVHEAEDCEDLWQIGKAAGGIRAETMEARAVLHGKATDGVTVIDMRARITKREPAVDGALLQCP